MRQRHIALAAGVVFGAMVVLHGGVAIAQSTDCKKNCQSAFSSCKDTVKAAAGQVKDFLLGAKADCKTLEEKQDKKDCLKANKGLKKLAKQSKKAALKRCKVDKGCRVGFCEEQAGLSGDDSCLVSSPMDSYGECIEAGLL